MLKFIVKAGLEWFPAVVFFAAYFTLGSFNSATIVLIAFTSSVWLLAKVTRQKMTRLMECSVWGLWLLGGLTVILHNPLFLMWKATVVFALIGVVFSINALITEETLVKQALDRFYLLSPKGWSRLQHAWSGWFVVLATSNILVAYNFSEEIWVQYKLFGSTGLIFFFILMQSWFLRHHLRTSPEPSS